MTTSAPVAPPRPPVVRGVCAAGVTPCGRSGARLYLHGWLCREHRPGRVDDVLAIVGSVRFAYTDGVRLAKLIIAREISDRRPDRIVSGGADGVDTLAEKAADHYGIPFLAHRPARQEWAAFKARNLLIAGGCTRALRIACAASKTYGSGWTTDRAQEQGKPVRRVLIDVDGQITDSGWTAVTHHPRGVAA